MLKKKKKKKKYYILIYIITSFFKKNIYIYLITIHHLQHPNYDHQCKQYHK